MTLNERLPRVRHPLALAYGVIAYLVGVRAMVYLVGFFNGWLVPKTIDSGPVGDRGAAMAIDALLLCGFAFVHSVTAREGWKRLLRRAMPDQLERSSYVLLAGVTLSALFWLWRPIPEPLWEIQLPWLRLAVVTLSAGGWIVCLLAVNTLGHLDLFGLRPAYRYAIGAEPDDPGLVNRGLYARVRNPLYFGFLVAVWAAPSISTGRLLFAALATGYVAIGLVFEERDLARRLGGEYLAFKARVPRFLPRWPSRPGERSARRDARRR